MLPAGRAATFIILGVNTLSQGDQERLLGWRDRREPTRVLAVSPRALFPLVEQGRFVADLYYRLNTVVLLAQGLDSGVTWQAGKPLRGEPRPR
jgi:hypothetical protein